MKPLFCLASKPPFARLVVVSTSSVAFPLIWLAQYQELPVVYGARSLWGLYAVVALCVFILGLLLYTRHRERLGFQREQQQREQLQMEVERRTAEIQHQKELLETQTLEIQTASEEMRQANNALLQANIALSNASEFKTRIVSIVSHDLKNPLGSMLGLSKIMESEAATPEQQVMAYEIGGLAQQMLHLVTDLLDSTAIESGKIDLQTTLINASDLVAAVVRQMMPGATMKQQVLTLESEAECCVQADERRLRQVFENLLSNAIKYSRFGKNIHVRLTCMSSTHGASIVRFSVEDEGPGLTDEDKRNVFGHFQKLSAKPTAGEFSSGVGLAIVKHITELHGGRVWVESELGKGATFTVELPQSF
jgi:signal transduction histidine kinase